MGIEVELLSEAGDIISNVADRHGLVAKLLPPISDTTSPFLRFIDPYGDTVFNRLQCTELKQEIKSRLPSGTDPKTTEHWNRILFLVEQAADETHLYVKFIGD